MDYLVQEKIGVILSLDGREEVNDRYRVLNNGQGSYKTILPKIHKMIEKGPISYYVRGTYTRSNLDFCEDVRHIADLGIDALSLEPAVGVNSDLAIREEDLPQVLKNTKNWLCCCWSITSKAGRFTFSTMTLTCRKDPAWPNDKPAAERGYITWPLPRKEIFIPVTSS